MIFEYEECNFLLSFVAGSRAPGANIYQIDFAFAEPEWLGRNEVFPQKGCQRKGAKVFLQMYLM